MKHDYYAMLAFTFVLLYLQPINCSLSTVTRYKRATDNTVQMSADEIRQITENPQSQTSDHKSVIKKCELLLQYLEAFNKAIKETPDTRKGGLGKTFEMIFPHNDGSNDANNVFHVMLKIEFEKDDSIITGKREAIAAVQKFSLGRKIFSKNMGLKKNCKSYL
ncbi:hypothetical protein DdX_17908 [Ditylenchus destructor]|uniref:Uncharacterized protein n=1 Tax=Ditylenchus destructor TaxID=166010 RepID=A0AAD4MNB1_9BILA|nr:hypothetical protein DdX_17908 [Ditylenchus destructor]